MSARQVRVSFGRLAYFFPQIKKNDHLLDDRRCSLLCLRRHFVCGGTLRFYVALVVQYAVLWWLAVVVCPRSAGKNADVLTH